MLILNSRPTVPLLRIRRQKKRHGLPWRFSIRRGALNQASAAQFNVALSLRRHSLTSCG
ncbi:hypothetical protein FHX58_000163 [Paraburkholderia tropica]|nr:hypothetical protein [Paraburkholderia tropica]